MLKRLQDEKGKICNLKDGYAVNCNPKNKGFDEVPLHATGFQWMQDVDIASRGRWPAHGMRAWVHREESDEVGVMNGNLLPEPYIDDNKVLGQFPSEYHLAYAARTLLREHYAATHPTYQVPEDATLLAAVEAADGTPSEVFKYERQRELDIVNVGTRQLFEAASLPDPDVLAQEIADDLRSALGQIEDILGDLGQRRKALTAVAPARGKRKK